MRRSRMILRTLSDRTTVTRRQQQVPENPSLWHDAIPPPSARRLTFVFSYVLERECEARVFALDNAHLAKGALADDAQQAEVVEVHCVAVRTRSFRPRAQAWQVQARCSSRGHDARLQHRTTQRTTKNCNLLLLWTHLDR